jgi:hypothetical protein
MKETVEKDKKKYTVLVFIILAAVIIFLILAGLQVFSTPKKAKGSISVSFDDKSIDSGKSTYMAIGAENKGKTPLVGEFVIKIDNPDEVTINYPSQDLLKFELMPGESIERRVNITGTSKAYKTYYKLIISIEGENSTYAKEEAILVVTND